MTSRLTTIFSYILICCGAFAQEANLLIGYSPKLSKFLTDNPEALKVLNQQISSVFSAKTVRLHYFYTDDEREPKAFHFYPKTPGLPDVLICVRENQLPLDEFISILFEIVNSNGEPRFARLVEDAKAGTISRTEFAKAFLKIEFEAEKGTRALLAGLELSKRDKTKSYYYGRYRELPDDFEAYLSFIKQVSPKIDAIGMYESEYDSLRKLK